MDAARRAEIDRAGKKIEAREALIARTGMAALRGVWESLGFKGGI